MFGKCMTNIHFINNIVRQLFYKTNYSKISIVNQVNINLIDGYFSEDSYCDLQAKGETNSKMICFGSMCLHQ